MAMSAVPWDILAGIKRGPGRSLIVSYTYLYGRLDYDEGELWQNSVS